MKPIRALLGLVIIAMLGVLVVSLYNVAHAIIATAESSDPASDPAATSSVAPAAVPSLRVARAFLASWASGADDYRQAGDSTNAPDTAQQSLLNFRAGLHLSAVSFGRVTFGGPVNSEPGASVVNFTVTARVDGGTWTYPSTLNVIQSEAGFASVEWSRSILFFGLMPGDRLVAGLLPAGSSPSRARGVALLDVDGNEISVLATFG